MSMNIFISGQRKAYSAVKGKQKRFTDIIEFTAWQTPTQVTYKIVNSNNPSNEYIEWVKVFPEVEHHLEQFNEFLKRCEDEGYKVTFEIV